MDEVQVSQLLTLGGLTIFTGVIVEALKRAFAMGQSMTDRFGPLLSMGVAIILAVIAVFVLQDNAVTPNSIFQAILTGILSGAAASGIYDAFDSGSATT